MHERFTDRARKVMQLANDEAQRFNHEYIGTEHILLGLVKEGSGVAANVLKNMGIDLQRVRDQVERIVQAGPDVDSEGKLPHTPRAKQVIQYAMEEARSLNHNYVGTEHLLLGLIQEGEGVASQVLQNLGVTLKDIREEVLNLLGHGIDNGTRTGNVQPITAEYLRWYLKAFLSHLQTNLKTKNMTPELQSQLPTLIKEVVDEVFPTDEDRRDP